MASGPGGRSTGEATHAERYQADPFHFSLSSFVFQEASSALNVPTLVITRVAIAPRQAPARGHHGQYRRQDSPHTARFPNQTAVCLPLIRPTPPILHDLREVARWGRMLAAAELLTASVQGT